MTYGQILDPSRSAPSHDGVADAAPDPEARQEERDSADGRGEPREVHPVDGALELTNHEVPGSCGHEAEEILGIGTTCRTLAADAASERMAACSLSSFAEPAAGDQR